MPSFTVSTSGNKVIIESWYEDLQLLFKCMMNHDAKQKAGSILHNYISPLKQTNDKLKWVLSIEESELVAKSLILCEMEGFLSEQFLGSGYSLLGESSKLKAKENSEFLERLALLSTTKKKYTCEERISVPNSTVRLQNHRLARGYVELFNQHIQLSKIEYTELHDRNFLKFPELNYEQNKTGNTLAIQIVNYYLAAVQEEKLLNTLQEVELYLVENSKLTEKHFGVLTEFKSSHKTGRSVSAVGHIDNVSLVVLFSTACESIL